MEAYLSIFLWLLLMLLMLYLRNSLPNPRSQRFLLIFSFKSSIALVLIFKSDTFELISVYSMSSHSYFYGLLTLNVFSCCPVCFGYAASLEHKHFWRGPFFTTCFRTPRPPSPSPRGLRSVEQRLWQLLIFAPSSCFFIHHNSFILSHLPPQHTLC